MITLLFFFLFICVILVVAVEFQNLIDCEPKCASVFKIDENVSLRHSFVIVKIESTENASNGQFHDDLNFAISRIIIECKFFTKC